MIAWCGETLFRIAKIIVEILVVWAIWSHVYNSNRGEPFIPVASLLLAGVIWLAGWACRTALVRR
jgi:hypothetical protein